MGLWYSPLTNNLSLGKETLSFSTALPTHSSPLFRSYHHLPLSLSFRHTKHTETVWGVTLLFKLIQCNPSLSVSCQNYALSSNEMIINGSTRDAGKESRGYIVDVIT